MKIRILSLILVICMCFGTIFVGQTVSASSLRGDLFADDRVDIIDLLYLRQYLSNIISLEANEVTNADCNGDGSVNIADIATLRNYLLKTGDLYKDPSWQKLRDWESDAQDVSPNKVTSVAHVNAVVGGLQSGENKKVSDSKQALYVKSEGLYYENNINGTNPTCAYHSSSNAPVKIQVIQSNSDTVLANAKNIRLSMKFKPVKDELAVIYVGFSFKGMTNFYYTRVTLESYEDFNYFYFADKEYTKVDTVTGARRTFLPTEEVETITLKPEQVYNIKHICFWMESNKGNTGAPLYVDDIEFYEGVEPYDSSREDAALKQPEAPVNDGKDKYIAISFDDGPQLYSAGNKHYMDYYMDVAKEYDAKFSFFLIGNNCDSGDIATLKRAVEEGHALENHTIAHNRLTDLTAEEGAAKIKELDDWLYSNVGVKTKYIRPPFLAVNSAAYSAMRLAGMKAAIAGPCPQDYNNPSVDYKELYYEKHLGDGVISLNHEHYIDNVETIRRLLEHFTARGYKFVTIDEIFKLKGVTPTLDKMYYSVND